MTAPTGTPAQGSIASDPALVAFGAILAATHVLTALSWRGDRDLARLLAEGRPALCWPVFERCADLRLLPAGFWEGVPWAVGLAGLVVTALFATRHVRAGTVGLGLLTAVGLAILLQDYRLRLNQHTMHTFVLAAFLFAPDKRRTLRWLLVAFYFWAGTIKLNADWLTGAALGELGVPGVPRALLPAACAYVVFLELVGVFGLFGPRWMRWATLAQLAVFHALSWGVVGFYYPLLMGGMLAIFPLCWASPRGPEGPPVAPAIAVGAVSLLQIVPLLAPGDPALTSQGRILALHMFDAEVVCEAHMDVHLTDGRTQRVEIPTDIGPSRMRCDPIVHWGVARHTCEQPGVDDLDLHLRSRRSTQPELRTVIALERFCAVDPTFDLWSNDWIHVDP
ncbi:MAG: hypothetical protein H6737_04490 [Alphaproteobacteria bacterium]|nr:hypothetical protein [Alphaproteobacteria bacterium]